MESNMSVTTIKVEDEKLLFNMTEILKKLFNVSADVEISAFKETSPGEERVYDVFKVSIGKDLYVMKKTSQLELDVFKKYLNGHHFSVPAYYHDFKDKDSIWIIEEFISGPDLKIFNDHVAKSSAKSLSTISNHYWIENPTFTRKNGRMDQYLKRIMKRRTCLKDRGKELKAYDIFIDRQHHCPRTLSHGDLLPCNAIQTRNEVVFIDWGFSGVMPYSLDPARLITHASEADNIFYMTDFSRETFLRSYYDQLSQTNLTYEEYLWDIQLSCLNESIEFIEESLKNPTLEGRDAFFEFYNQKLIQLTEGILNKTIVII